MPSLGIIIIIIIITIIIIIIIIIIINDDDDDDRVLVLRKLAFLCLTWYRHCRGYTKKRSENKISFILVYFTSCSNYMISQGVSSSQDTSKKSGEKEKETASSSTNHSLPDPLATALLKVLATVLQCFATASPEEKEVATLVQRMVDLIR